MSCEKCGEYSQTTIAKQYTLQNGVSKYRYALNETIYVLPLRECSYGINYMIFLCFSGIFT